jgi:hypothetical protein
MNKLWKCASDSVAHMHAKIKLFMLKRMIKCYLVIAFIYDIA